LDAKAAGYKALVQSCASDPSATAVLLLIEKLTEITGLQVEAIKNMPIEKVVVWDSGGGDGGLADLGRRFMGVLPPMHELAKMAGLELPEFFGRVHGKSPSSSASAPAPADKK